MTDDFREPTEDEIREAEELARALDDANPEHELAVLAEDLRSAHRPAPLERMALDAIVERAVLGRPRVSLVRSSPTSPVPVRRGLAYGVVSAFLVAAGVTFVASRVLTPEASPVATSVRLDLVLATSTEPLFRESYEASRGSDRIDRIARARAADLRENRFRGWGVR